MKKVFIHREGAFGDHVHMSPVIRAYHEAGWQVDALYNWKGAQIHTHNPMISNHFFFEMGAKDATLEKRMYHLEMLNRARKEYDRFITLQNSLEDAFIHDESTPEYFWPHWMRRQKSEGICFYDQSMKWAGLTNKKYMGWTGDIFFTPEEDSFVLDWLKPYRNNFIILWAIRGSMYQKAMYPIAEEICNEFIKMHPETVIITTGDKFCQQWEWEHPKVIHRSGRMPFRQALCMAQYVDMVVTPETGLGIGAGAFSTPKIMLLTAASTTNICGNDKNDYSLQSPAWCSPCFRAIYNTNNCEISQNQSVNGVAGKFKAKPIDPCAMEFGETKETMLPICIDFPKDLVLGQMDRIYNAKHERDWTRPRGKKTTERKKLATRNTSKIGIDRMNRKRPISAIDDIDLGKLVQVAKTAPPGDFVEIGVYRGGSAWFLDAICYDQDRILHLFDTFEGMPFSSEIDTVPRGYFNGRGVSYDETAELYPDAKLYKGIFPDTLPADLNNVAFVHVDCDQYESIKSAIEVMPDRMVEGGIMYFDDYNNLPGAKKAIDENLKDFIVVGQRAIWTKTEANL